ncbi:WD40 repeat domain-containing protein [Frankia sp. CpI1-P]|uniref:WD40 repeat domain-containing protein n=1 Tax=Frankia sp. CpI1-P TaxID=1502734 RepID=UPI00210150D0|nr:WD40 repeat domain-containing protein [Frankia sp. CpI1-P]
MLAALRRAVLRNAHLLGPTDPPASLGAVLTSRLDGSPELDDARSALAAHVARPRLTNRWSRPDQPHPALRRTFAGHRRWVDGLAVAPDGRSLASTGGDGAIRLWEVPDGRGQAVLAGHDGDVSACAFAPDGRALVSAGADGTVRIWAVPRRWDDGSPVRADGAWPAGPAVGPAVGPGRPAAPRVLRGHHGEATACMFSPDGARVLSVGADGTLRGWDAFDGEPLLTVTLADAPLRCCVVAPAGDWLAVAGDDGVVRICDPLTGRQTTTLTGHVGPVLSLTVAPDGTWLGSAGRDGTLRRWTMPAGRQIGLIREDSGAIHAAAVDRAGRLLVTTSREGVIRLWDAPTGRHRADLSGAVASRACVLAPDGTWVAAGGRYGAIRLWATDVDLPKPSVGGRDGPMRGCAVVAPRGGESASLVVAYTDDGTAVWDLDTGERTGVAIGGVADRVRGAEAGPDGAWVLVPADLTALRRWDPVTGAVLGTLTADAEITGFALDPTGSWAVAACRDGTLPRWDVMTGHPLPPLAAPPAPTDVSGPPVPRGAVEACAVSPDGRWVAAGGEGRTVRLWEVATGRLRRELAGHTDGVLGVAFSPDGGLLASAAADHTVRVWLVGDGASVATLTGHQHTVRSARFSPDGAWLATAGGDGALLVWDTTSWTCAAVMRFDGGARDCVWLPPELGGGIILACSAGLHRYDLDL